MTVKINTTASERDKQEAEDLAAKLKLERPFANDVRSFLKNLADDFAVIYTKTGTILQLGTYDSELIGILNRNYKKVQNKFNNNLRSKIAQSKQTDQELKEEQNRLDEEIAAALLLWRMKQANDQALIILNTTERIMQDAVNSTITNAAQQGIQLTNKQIADQVKKKLKDGAKGRADIISMTETQITAEASKQIEAVAIDGSILIGGAAIKKQWKTVLDERTRVSHAVANGQTRLLLEPYAVQGERLMYPSDTSLGASAGNIINCRCSSVQII